MITNRTSRDNAEALGYCLTAVARRVGLTQCEPGRPNRQWHREPWRSTTWKRDAWQISSSGNHCLYQDDRHLSARRDDRNRQSPELTLSDCGTQLRPELYWRWGG